MLLGVSTRAVEYHPAFSPDGGTFFFVRGGALQQMPVGEVGLP